VRLYSDIFLIPRSGALVSERTTRTYSSRIFLSQSRKGRKLKKHTQRLSTNQYRCFSFKRAIFDAIKNINEYREYIFVIFVYIRYSAKRNVSIIQNHSHVFLSQSHKGRKVKKHTQRLSTNQYRCFSLNAPSSMASRTLTYIENIFVIFGYILDSA
jgi:hypothetical protein